MVLQALLDVKIEQGNSPLSYLTSLVKEKYLF